MWKCESNSFINYALNIESNATDKKKIKKSKPSSSLLSKKILNFVESENWEEHHFTSKWKKEKKTSLTKNFQYEYQVTTNSTRQVSLSTDK